MFCDHSWPIRDQAGRLKSRDICSSGWIHYYKHINIHSWLFISYIYFSVSHYDDGREEFGQWQCMYVLPLSQSDQILPQQQLLSVKTHPEKHSQFSVSACLTNFPIVQYIWQSQRPVYVVSSLCLRSDSATATTSKCQNSWTIWHSFDFCGIFIQHGGDHCPVNKGQEGEGQKENLWKQ